MDYEIHLLMRNLRLTCCGLICTTLFEKLLLLLLELLLLLLLLLQLLELWWPNAELCPSAYAPFTPDASLSSSLVSRRFSTYSISLSGLTTASQCAVANALAAKQRGLSPKFGWAHHEHGPLARRHSPHVVFDTHELDASVLVAALAAAGSGSPAAEGASSSSCEATRLSSRTMSPVRAIVSGDADGVFVVCLWFVCKLHLRGAMEMLWFDFDVSYDQIH